MKMKNIDSLCTCRNLEIYGLGAVSSLWGLSPNNNIRKRRIFSNKKLGFSHRGDGTVRQSQIGDLPLQQIRVPHFSEIHSPTLPRCPFLSPGENPFPISHSTLSLFP